MVVLNSEVFKPLSESDIEKIHSTSVRLLEEVGVEFSHEKAVQVFEDNDVRVEGKRVYLSSSILDRALGKAPSHFTIHARNPDNNVEVNDNNAILAPGYGATFVKDLDNGRRKASYRDYLNLTKLASASDYLDVLGGVIVEPNEISEDIKHAKMFFAGAKYSDKCLMGSAMGEKKAGDCLEMARILFGEEELIDDRPILVSLINTNSPMKYDRRMAGALVKYAEYNQPVAITSGAMAGTTAPMSLAGTLVQENCEVLAGIVLTQLINPGAPVFYGPGASITDMKTAGTAIGSPEYAKLISAGAQLSRYYGIPSRASGALTDSLNTDAQAGYESMMSLMSGVNSGLNFIIHAAGILEGFQTTSYEKFMVDDEIMGMIDEYQTRMEISGETLAEEVVREVATDSGHYLNSQYTLDHMKDFREPFISNRTSDKPVEKRANEKWKEIISGFSEPYLDSVVEEHLEDYIEQL